MKSIIGFLLIPTMLVFASSITTYQKTEKGIIIELKKQKTTESKLLLVEVLDEKIVHVIASPVDSLSSRPSLMIKEQNLPPVKWNVTEKENEIIITTSELKIIINSVNGAISFLNANGNSLLSEKSSDGKIFTSTEILGENTFNAQQLFDSPEDEAFYGLGAHQNNVFNYKGTDVDLWQLNIINAVPFLISSRNYGILWDNNSQTKFGDIRNYQSLSSLKLFDKNGNEGGLTAEYFKDSNFQSLFTSRTENRIEHEFIDVNDDYPEGFSDNVAAIRWSGEIECNEPGIHKFRLYASAYVKMWLNDELICDSYRQNWLPWTYMPRLNMEAGKKYKIKIEWIHMGGYIGLKYLTPEDEIYKNCISLWSEVADQIDYYFIHGNTIDKIIEGYRTITGKAPMMPKWAMGLWQCRERYRTQDELLEVVKEFRKRNIPLDNIVQDWFYWPEDKWGDHDFDKDRFPNPDEMIKTLHGKLNTQIMISVWPKFYINTLNYKKFDENGWLYKRNIEKGQRDWVGPGYISTFYDPYDITAREMYWKLINEKLFSKGIDAWWLDSTEPDIQSNLSREEIKLLIGPTALGTGARYLNSYSLVNSQAVYEGQLKTDPNKRVFILTRSAFPGQQRYSAATWSGDVASRWYDLKAQVPAGLNFCISGLPYWTTDIGGFAVEPRFEKPNAEDLEEWRELNTRWFQFGAFCPLFRVHGQFPYREMFNIAPEDHPAYKTMLAYDKLRYRLMPYIYSLTGEVTHDDYTIMRALIMDFPHDKITKNIGDQFMFGPAILVNPVTEYKARSRSVYLPQGVNWFDLYSGTSFEGGKIIESPAPYEQIPLFVKEGSIIPCGPEINYTTEKPADPIRLFVYTGSDAFFKLYEDENINNNYVQGKFSVIPIEYDETEKQLTIKKREGSFFGMIPKRTFEIIFISKDKYSGLNFENKPDAIIYYDGNEASVLMNN